MGIVKNLLGKFTNFVWNMTEKQFEHLEVLEQYREVDIEDWAASNPGCDALVLTKDYKKDGKMTVVVYAKSPEGNYNLRRIKDSVDEKVVVFNNMVKK